MKQLSSMALSAAMALCAASSAVGQETGPWSVKAGYNQFKPQVSSGEITAIPGSGIDVGKDGGLLVGVGYRISDTLAAELLVGVPPRMDITGTGMVALLGKIADTKVLTPILGLKYSFLDGAAVLRKRATHPLPA